MTISDVEEELPSGFHDAELLEVRLDYPKRHATLTMNISVGDPDAPSQEEREAIRKAALELSDVAYFAIELPDERYPFRRASFLRVDAAVPDDSELAAKCETAFSFRFFVNEWNAFIRGAADDARLTWLE